ncbi:DUF6193 family natural product biosynthesis protein [Streptomyces sp. NPDC090077]|uniref:DUF6193 family natural product biosynthesis protein n=1 Tax=Streptomyces sp. NPDC090077 TaxID=3365938 RepID=UPI0038141191
MDHRPDPADLYPDAAAHGSLAAMLRALAEEGGSPFPVTDTSRPEELLYASVESRSPLRHPLYVTAGAFERGWSVRGEDSFQDAPLVQGETDDPEQLARAARGWYEGTPLEEIRDAAPFVRLTGRFEVPDQDPVLMTESEWQGMRVEAAEKGGPGYRELVEAAYEEPALRALFPFTSHWVLRFSTTTRPALTIAGPCVLTHAADRYTVSPGFLGTDPYAETTTAREAVAAAVRHLPPGLGPVTVGRIRRAEGG